jgi:hypothetical protein
MPGQLDGNAIEAALDLRDRMEAFRRDQNALLYETNELGGWRGPTEG